MRIPRCSERPVLGAWKIFLNQRRIYRRNIGRLWFRREVMVAWARVVVQKLVDRRVV